MGIKPICDYCGDELEDFGALLFSPPRPNRNFIVEKYHCCINCYEKIRPKKK